MVQREISFSMRLSEEERGTWRRAADERGISLADFVRLTVKMALCGPKVDRMPGTPLTAVGESREGGQQR